MEVLLHVLYIEYRSLFAVWSVHVFNLLGRVWCSEFVFRRHSRFKCCVQVSSLRHEMLLIVPHQAFESES